MIRTLLFTTLLLTSPFSFSQEATGTIDEIQVCATGNSGNGYWVRTLQFRIEDKWFAIWADHYGAGNDYDNNIGASVIFMAYSQSLNVQVKASDPWYDIFKKCGVMEGSTMHSTAGDYIRLAK